MILWIDCPSGAGGDMLLAALIDMGFPLLVLRKVLRQLGLSRVVVLPRRIFRNGMAAPRLAIRSSGEPPVPSWQIGLLLDFVRDSDLSPRVKNPFLRVLSVLGQAEGKVHARPWRSILLRQLGRVDTLAAFAGFCAGLDYFGVDRVYLSRVPLGRRHHNHDGEWERRPAPATGILLRRFPVDHREDDFEWTTPTAAALLSALAMSAPAPPFLVEKYGHAVGTRQVPRGSGVLRVLLGTVY